MYVVRLIDEVLVGTPGPWERIENILGLAPRLTRPDVVDDAGP